ncbi:MAG TPA: class I SAM-dependent methyltransferase [Mycobacteriales bacterium]|nr:class I SAM-dependent methyltransferase [Mycobacteriales bacterium]
MSVGGTAAYRDLTNLPPLVRRAVDTAAAAGFDNSCRPEQGRLLAALAQGASRIGETGTGCGVGLAWLVSGAAPTAELVSVERDLGRAALATDLFADASRVTVITGDWTQIAHYAPFDLLVLDGGGGGKGADDEPAPVELLRPGGTIVIDDLTPAAHWPPRFGGRVDEARMYWLRHPELDTAELRLAPDFAALVATRRHPGQDG